MSSPGKSSDFSDIKYARGTGARVPPSHRPLRPLEWAVLIHLAILLIGTTWGFGGGAELLRPIIAWWGSLGCLLTLAAVQDREAWRDGWIKPLRWLAPLVVFNLLVLLGCFHPSFRELTYDTEIILVPTPTGASLPTSTRPALSLHALWLFNALWISSFNLALVIRQRRALRGLLILIGVNALILAVFGTVQKLSHSDGLFFGAVPSPQKHFFASFIYHNHWGAFALLSISVFLALIWHYARRSDDRNFFHSPAFGGLVAVLLLALTIPLSNSRSSTLLSLALLGGAFFHWIFRLIRHRRRFRQSVALPLSTAVAALALAAAGVWFIAQDSIAMRLALTKEQVGMMRAMGGLGSRADLYRDTWRMAREKPWFGWGMASYPHVFTLYNTQKSVDKLPVFYRDAHSDWLQSLAEHGFVGTTMLGLCALVPLLHLRRRHLASPVPAYLLAGCGLILLYATVEFPLGNIAVVLTWWVCFFSAVHYARLYDREAATPIKSISSAH